MLNWCENRYCGMDEYYLYFFVNGSYRAIKHSDIITISNREHDVEQFSIDAKKLGGRDPFEIDK